MAGPLVCKALSSSASFFPFPLFSPWLCFKLYRVSSGLSLFLSVFPLHISSCAFFYPEWAGFLVYCLYLSFSFSPSSASCPLCSVPYPALLGPLSLLSSHPSLPPSSLFLPPSPLTPPPPPPACRASPAARQGRSGGQKEARPHLLSHLTPPPGTHGESLSSCEGQRSDTGRFLLQGLYRWPGEPPNFLGTGGGEENSEFGNEPRSRRGLIQAPGSKESNPVALIPSPPALCSP